MDFWAFNIKVIEDLKWYYSFCCMSQKKLFWINIFDSRQFYQAWNIKYFIKV